MCLDPSSSKEDPQLFVVTRKQWDAHPAEENITKLLHPVPNILFTHTATTTCVTFGECKKVLKEIQRDHMDIGFKDIAHK